MIILAIFGTIMGCPLNFEDFQDVLLFKLLSQYDTLFVYIYIYEVLVDIYKYVYTHIYIYSLYRCM